VTAVKRTRSGLALAGAVVAVLLLAAPAGASQAGASPAGASTSSAGLYITGAGFGHGIGMSQYGAAGYALHGYGYKQILHDYYAQTTLAHVNPNRSVTVLLKPKGAAAFSGATTIKGASQTLNVKTGYSILVAGAKLRIVSAGRTIGTFNSPLQVSGPGPLKLIGAGSYRGAFVFRPSTAGGGVMTVNSVTLDNYVRGVVSAEMPAGWPQQALDAQAVAARSYAIAAGPIGPNFELYDDTRSQMYEGVSAETRATNAAVTATSGQVVDYDGSPAVTYFFASSGGRTESIQNVWSGVAPEAWLVSESDPYDDSFNNPYYRWNMNVSLGTVDAKLGKLVDGKLKGINVLQRGVSPRVVRAQIVGTKGTTTISGARLQQDFVTPSTWMSFTTVSAQGVASTGVIAPPPASTPMPTAIATPSATTTTGGAGATDGTPTTYGTTTTGGTTPEPTTGGTGLGPNLLARAAAGFGSAVTGTIYPVTAGLTVTAEHDAGGAWTFAGTGQVAADGSYTIPVLGPGTYRVLYNGIIGPEITVS
jgi:stage II sporulation protein D